MEIELNNINKSYGNHEILKNFNLKIDKGEMVSLTGVSGKGKSTLLNIIGLLDKPDSGEVIIHGEKNPYKSKNQIKLLRYTIGYLFQNFALVDNITVNKNLDIALEYVNGNKNEIKKKALERVGLYNKLENKIYELSGGEQQRIALARLMIKSAEIILADEPTGALDDINRDMILEILKELNDQGKTIIIVTHDNVVADMCKRRICL